MFGECLPYLIWPSPLVWSAVGVFLLFLQFFLPFLILVFCYGRIVWVLSKRIGSNISSGDSQSDKFQLARKNTIETFLIISVCYVICYAISQIYYLMFNLGYNANWDGAFFKVATLMAFGNCMVNPVVYFFKYRDFQNALRLSMCCCRGEIDKGRYQLKKEKIESLQQVSENTCETVS